MLQPSLTNRIIKYAAYATVILSFIIAVLTASVVQGDEVAGPLRFLVFAIIFGSGIFSSLLLFAISEALSRLQNIEYNTEKTYKECASIRASS